MKKFFLKHKNIIKISAALFCSCGLAWTGFQIHKTHQMINNALNPSIIDLLEPENNSELKSKDQLFKKLFEKYKDDYLSGPLTRWTYFKFLYAQKLISLAKSNFKPVRNTAISQLCHLHNLEPWQYQIISQMCDPKTAVRLARIFASDLRFIREPPLRNQILLQEDVIDTVKKLLTKLNPSEHICISYFLETVFPDEYEHKFIDNDHIDVGLLRMIESTNNILPLCVESLLHHSSNESQARDIASHNGLSILMEVYKLYSDNVDVNISICKILSHISTFPQFLEEMHDTGWIRILAEWARNSDLRLSLPATKTLANLDADKNISGLYSRSLYVLHPTCSNDEETYVDVIFIHGLLGGVFFTWRQRAIEKETVGLIGKQRDKGQPKSRKFTRPDKILSDPVESISNNGTYYKCPPVKESKLKKLMKKKSNKETENIETDYEFVLYDLPTKSNSEGKGPFSYTSKSIKKSSMEDYSQCWPKDWLPEDCKHLRIIGINYDTNLSMWAPICPMEKCKATLEERSNEMMAKLIKAGVGERPIVWVTHSMGGLIAKNILGKAWNSKESNVKDIAQKTKSIIFYSTPHTGSKIASATTPTSYVLWPSVEVQELRQEYAGLRDIHKNFLDYIREHPLHIVSFIETKPILVTAMKFNILLVEPESGNLGIGEYFEIPLDHLGICKPKNKESFLYQKTLDTILRVVDSEKYSCEDYSPHSY